MKRFTILSFVCTFTIVMMCCHWAEAAPKITLKVGHNQSASHSCHIALEEFKRVLEAETNGNIMVELYPNGILGDDASMLEQVALGSLHSCLLLAGPYYVSDIDGRGNIEELPYLFDDVEAARAGYDGEFGEYVRTELIEPLLHVKVLDFWESGFRNFTNNIRPIYTPQDMAGIKFRVPDSEIRKWTFEAYNATGVPMSWSEVYTGLQQGTIDGQENPIAVVYANNLSEVQKYLSISNYVYCTSMLIMNPSFYKKFNESEIAALNKAAEAGCKVQRSLNDQEEERMIKELEQAGMKVNVVDYEAFRNASKQAWDKFVEKYGPELIERATGKPYSK